MTRTQRIALSATFAGLLLGVAPLTSQAPAPRPLAFQLACAEVKCPFLTGEPQTTGMRSGFVRLKPGESIGWHSTAQNEETLVVLRGRGEALIEGRSKLALDGPGLAYIPPQSKHNILNTGTKILEYVYVVAPAKLP